MRNSPTYAPASEYRQTGRPGSRAGAGTRRALGVAALTAVMVFSGALGGGAAFADPSISLAPAASLALIPPASCTTAAPRADLSAASVDGVFDGTTLRAAQVDVAATIVKTGQELGITDRGIRIALAVAMDASSLTPTVVNTPFVGLYQQKADPTSGLYLDFDRADPAGSSTMFFNQLVKRVPGYETDARSDWELGEVVQESGHGNEFEEWDGLATQLLLKISSGVDVAAVDSALPEVATTTLQAPRMGTVGAMPFALRSQGLAFAGAEPTDGSGASPAAEESSTDESAADGSSAGSQQEAGSADSVAAETSTVDPGTSGSTETGTGSTEPTGTQPTGSDSTSSDPTTTDPGTDPATSPGTTTPGTTDPGTSVPGSTDSTTTGTTTTDPTTTTTPVPDGSTTTPTTEPPPSIPADNIGDDGAIIVPELPEPPVPTGTTDDPQVGEDSSRMTPEDNSDSAAAAAQSAVLDCAPNNNGGSTTFDPGEIISDAVFYNSGAMTTEQVNGFIQEKGAACSGQYCLKNLRVTTTSQAADKYCAAYAGGTNETAAAVITKVSVACRVNPQVMLVTLQKESALLTKTSPTASSYNAAWGWHCPDTGPGGTANCDPKYAGFFNQAYGMAKQWARYVVEPLKYNFQAGETTQILWNVVESGCGGAPVTIRNTATASLYNYTPYQPNAASLAAYPGVGDRCSTYGNRNFFFLFQKYFGVTGGGAPAYVVVNGVDVTIPAGPHVAAGAAGQVITAPNAAVAKGIAAGLASIGLPYVWGGGSGNGAADQGCSRGGGSLNSCQGTVGFDCSGLTGYVLAQAGFTTGTNSAAQRSAGTSVPWQQALAGDIIGYSGHVAIYLGKINGVDYLLEAPAVGMYVQVRPVYMTNNGVAVDNVLHRYWS